MPDNNQNQPQQITISFPNGKEQKDNSLSKQEREGVDLLIAPNGQQSNLSPELYAYVRTPEFKQWFGDWEKGLHIMQDNDSYYRGQYEEPLIDENGNLILKGKKDSLYIKAGYDVKEGVSATTDMSSAEEYGANQRYAYEADIEDKYGELDQSWEKEQELNDIAEHGYYLIQFPKNISNQIINEAGEVKIVGDVIIPKGRYVIEHITDDDRKIIATANNNTTKIIDENGEPLVLYRGQMSHANAPFVNYGDGIYFTPQREAAMGYGADHDPIPVFLNAHNPYEVDFDGDSDNEETDYHADIRGEYHYAKDNNFDILIATNTFDGENNLDQYVVHNDAQVRRIDTLNLKGTGTIGNNLTNSLNDQKHKDNMSYQINNLIKEPQTPLPYNDIDLRDKLIDIMRNAGIAVNTDWKQGQAVIDAAESQIKLMAQKGNKKTTTSERSGAVAGNSSSGSLQYEVKGHLNRRSFDHHIDTAKIQKNTDIAKIKIKKVKNDDNFKPKDDNPNNITRFIANKLGLEKSASSQSFYQDYYEGDFNIGEERTVRVRLSTHPATGERLGNAPTDDKISLVVYKNGEHHTTGQGYGEYSEWIYDPQKMSGEQIARQIINGIDNLLNNGEYIDPTISPVIYPSTETAQIIAQAQANGTYLKAPNGEDTTLQEKQWAQVRTTAFGNWFGNWQNGVIFTANNVNDIDALKRKYPSALPNKFYHHSTNKFGFQPFDTREGKQEKLHIIGRLTTDKVDCLVVENPNCNNAIPHITLATAEGIKPFESNKELAKHQDKIKPLDDYVDTTFRNNLRNDVSKLINKNGEPMVLYHGTNVEFNTFEQKEGLRWHGWGEQFTANAKGFFFSDNFDDAKKHAHSNAFMKGGDEIVMPVYVSMKKPADLSGDGKNDIEELFHDLTGYYPLEHPEYHQRNQWWRIVEDEEFDIPARLKELGYDGIIFAEKVNEYTDVTEEKSYYVTNPNQIKSATLNNGEFSLNNNDIRFQLADSSSLSLPTQQPIFISNALLALQQIQQQKATPQQWLGMLKNLNGIKPGEDRWTGLSDWLTNNTEKSLTKQQVLDYIAQNQIIVEETHYEDLEHSPRFKDLYQEFLHEIENVNDLYWEAKEDYDDFYNRMVEEYGEDFDIENDLTEEEREEEEELFEEKNVYDTDEISAEEQAFQLMVEKYGKTFESAFAHDGDMLIIENDEDAGIFLYGNNVKQIDDIRLRYTTKNLDNKHEITLTVPTIESWNQNDKIHFGDANNGRAVAWIRFGDTTISQKDPNAKERLDNAQKAWDDFGGKMYDKYGASYSLHLNEKEKEENKKLYEEFKNATNEFKKANKNIRVLVIDEIQSKRHQEGRERGYRNVPLEEIDASYKEIRKKLEINRQQHNDFMDAMFEKYGVQKEGGFEDVANWMDLKNHLSDEDKIEDQRLEDEYNHLSLSEVGRSLDEEYKIAYSKIPAAPFEKNWHELAMKRMLRYAAENGYDRVAWINGEQQAERYDIGNVINEIVVGEKRSADDLNYYFGDNKIQQEGKVVTLMMKDSDDTLSLAVDDDGKIIYCHETEEMENKKLEQLVGKKLAEDIMKADNQTFSTDDIKIGMEGMIAFYDQMLPNFINKYTKKWDVHTEDVQIPNIEEWGIKTTLHSIPITSQMKNDLMQSQPMFFLTPQGDAYGFTHNNTIYIDPRIATSETPIHEYAHLWAQAMRQYNQEEWQNIVQLMKQVEPVWEMVQSKYSHLSSDSDIAEEVLAQYSGRVGAERLKKALQDYDGNIDSKQAQSILDRIKVAIDHFWQKTADFLHIHYESADQVASRVMHDLLHQVNPQAIAKQLNANDARVDLQSDRNEGGDLQSLTQPHPILAYSSAPYLDVQSLAHGVKDGDTEAIKKAAARMADVINVIPDKQNIILVPMPSHNGSATYTKTLAEEVAKLTGLTTADVLSVQPHQPLYDYKLKNGIQNIPIPSFNIKEDFPKDKIPLIIDNVLDTGTTAYAAAHAFGSDNNARVAVLGNTDNFYHFHNGIVLESEKLLDIRYLNAVERDDLETAQQMVNAQAQKMGYSLDDIERDAHVAPGATHDTKDFRDLNLHAQSIENGENVNLFAIANGISPQPDNYFTHPLAPRWYMYDDQAGRESQAAIMSAIRNIQYQTIHDGDVKNMPEVTVYRAVPKEINEDHIRRNGEWVSPSLSYAINHGEHRLGIDNYRIIAEKIPADQLWWDGNDIREWGVDDGRSYAFHNTRNNAKLLDPVTYDNQGNVIPLSQRFNAQNADIHFQLVGQRGATQLDLIDHKGRIDNLHVAQQMERADRTPKEIKIATGWERGADNKWRYEMPDAYLNQDSTLAKYADLKAEFIQLNDMGFNERNKEKKQRIFRKADKIRQKYIHMDITEKTVGEAIDPNSDVLRAYPELANVNLKVINESTITLNGYYDEKNNTIMLNLGHLKSQDEIRSTLLHEMQHFIQTKEGFAQGANIDQHIPDVVIRDVKNNIDDLHIGIKEKQDKLNEIHEQLPEMRQLLDNVKVAFRNHGVGSPEIIKAMQDVKDFRSLHEEKFNLAQQLNKEIDDDNKKIDSLYKYLNDNVLGYDYYNKMAGEVEARNVQSRMLRNPAINARTTAKSTEDVTRDEQIVSFDYMLSANESQQQLQDAQNKNLSPTDKDIIVTTDNDLKNDILQKEIHKDEDNPHIGYSQTISDGGQKGKEHLSKTIFYDSKEIGMQTADLETGEINPFRLLREDAYKEHFFLDMFVSPYDLQKDKWDGIDGKELDGYYDYGCMLFNDLPQMVDFYEAHKQLIDYRNERSLLIENTAKENRKAAEEISLMLPVNPTLDELPKYASQLTQLSKNAQHQAPQQTDQKTTVTPVAVAQQQNEKSGQQLQTDKPSKPLNMPNQTQQHDYVQEFLDTKSKLQAAKADMNLSKLVRFEMPDGTNRIMTNAEFIMYAIKNDLKVAATPEKGNLPESKVEQINQAFKNFNENIVKRNLGSYYKPTPEMMSYEQLLSKRFGGHNEEKPSNQEYFKARDAAINSIIDANTPTKTYYHVQYDSNGASMPISKTMYDYAVFIQKSSIEELTKQLKNLLSEPQFNEWLHKNEDGVVLISEADILRLKDGQLQLGWYHMPEGSKQPEFVIDDLTKRDFYQQISIITEGIENATALHQDMKVESLLNQLNTDRISLEEPITVRLTKGETVTINAVAQEKPGHNTYLVSGEGKPYVPYYVNSDDFNKVIDKAIENGSQQLLAQQTANDQNVSQSSDQQQQTNKHNQELQKINEAIDNAEKIFSDKMKEMGLQTILVPYEIMLKTNLEFHINVPSYVDWNPDIDTISPFAVLLDGDHIKLSTESGWEIKDADIVPDMKYVDFLNELTEALTQIKQDTERAQDQNAQSMTSTENNTDMPAYSQEEQDLIKMMQIDNRTEIALNDVYTVTLSDNQLSLVTKYDTLPFPETKPITELDDQAREFAVVAASQLLVNELKAIFMDTMKDAGTKIVEITQDNQPVTFDISHDDIQIGVGLDGAYTHINELNAVEAVQRLTDAIAKVDDLYLKNYRNDQHSDNQINHDQNMENLDSTSVQKQIIDYLKEFKTDLLIGPDVQTTLDNGQSFYIQAVTYDEDSKKFFVSNFDNGDVEDMSKADVNDIQNFLIGVIESRQRIEKEETLTKQVTDYLNEKGFGSNINLTDDKDNTNEIMTENNDFYLTDSDGMDKKYAVVRIPDYNGGYEHSIMDIDEANYLAENEAFHYIEWEGTAKDILKADNITFENHYEPWHEEQYDEIVSLTELALNAGIIRINVDKQQEESQKTSQEMIDKTSLSEAIDSKLHGSDEYYNNAMHAAREHIENAFPDSFISLSDPMSHEETLSVIIDGKDTRIAPMVINPEDDESKIQAFAFVDRDTYDTDNNDAIQLAKDYKEQFPDKIMVGEDAYAFFNIKDAIEFKKQVDLLTEVKKLDDLVEQAQAVLPFANPQWERDNKEQIEGAKLILYGNDSGIRAEYLENAPYNGNKGELAFAVGKDINAQNIESLTGIYAKQHPELIPYNNGWDDLTIKFNDIRFALQFHTFVQLLVNAEPKLSEAQTQNMSDIKERYPDSLILNRNGDKYEAYGKDAKILSSLLELPTNYDRGFAVSQFDAKELHERLPQLIAFDQHVSVIDNKELSIRTQANVMNEIGKQLMEMMGEGHHSLIGHPPTEQLQGFHLDTKSDAGYMKITSLDLSQEKVPTVALKADEIGTSVSLLLLPLDQQQNLLQYAKALNAYQSLQQSIDEQMSQKTQSAQQTITSMESIASVNKDNNVNQDTNKTADLSGAVTQQQSLEQKATQLINELGLNFTPVVLRTPVVIPADLDDWQGQDVVLSHVMLANDKIMAYTDRNDAYDNNNGINISELSAGTQSEIIQKLNDQLSDNNRNMTVYVDTQNVPEWAINALINGDNQGLTDKEIQMVNNFYEKYPDHIFSPRHEDTSFDNHPAFGEPTDTIPVDIVRIATPAMLRQEVLAEQQSQNSQQSQAEQTMVSMDDTPYIGKTTSQSLQQQAEEFYNATGIQLEIQGDNLVHNGDIDLSKTDIKELPDNLTVKGNLWLQDTKIEKLPDNLTVERELDLGNTPIKELPNNFSANSILLDYSKIEKLPDNLSVKMNLDLEGTPIKELPKNLTIGGDLDVRKTSITELPEDLKVGNGIYLSHTNIEKLPDNLTVNETLDLSDTPIKELPKNLTVKKDLWLNNTNIEKLPNDISVGGGLYLSNIPIKELPDNLTINGELELTGTFIGKLPKGLTVNGDLHLAETKITQLPDDLKVKGNIYMDDHTIKATPDVMTPDGYIDLMKANAQSAIDKDKTTSQDLGQLNEAKIEKFLSGGMWFDERDAFLENIRKNDNLKSLVEEKMNLRVQDNEHIKYAESEIQAQEHRVVAMMNTLNELAIPSWGGLNIELNDNQLVWQTDHESKVRNIRTLQMAINDLVPQIEEKVKNIIGKEEDNEIFVSDKPVKVRTKDENNNDYDSIVIPEIIGLYGGKERKIYLEDSEGVRHPLEMLHDESKILLLNDVILSSNDRSEEIEAYLTNQMPKEQRTAFEKEMENNPDLKEDVKMTAFIIQGIREKGKEEDEKIIERIQQEIPKAEEEFQKAMTDLQQQQTSQNNAQKASQQTSVEPSQNDLTAAVTPVDVPQQQNDQTAQQGQAEQPDIQTVDQSANQSNTQSAEQPLASIDNNTKVSSDTNKLPDLDDDEEISEEEIREWADKEGIPITFDPLKYIRQGFNEWNILSLPVQFDREDIRFMNIEGFVNTPYLDFSTKGNSRPETVIAPESVEYQKQTDTLLLHGKNFNGDNLTIELEPINHKHEQKYAYEVLGQQLKKPMEEAMLHAFKTQIAAENTVRNGEPTKDFLHAITNSDLLTDNGNRIHVGEYDMSNKQLQVTITNNSGNDTNETLMDVMKVAKMIADKEAVAVLEKNIIHNSTFPSLKEVLQNRNEMDKSEQAVLNSKYLNTIFENQDPNGKERVIVVGVHANDKRPLNETGVELSVISESGASFFITPDSQYNTFKQTGNKIDGIIFELGQRGFVDREKAIPLNLLDPISYSRDTGRIMGPEQLRYDGLMVDFGPNHFYFQQNLSGPDEGKYHASYEIERLDHGTMEKVIGGDIDAVYDKMRRELQHYDLRENQKHSRYDTENLVKDIINHQPLRMADLNMTLYNIPTGDKEMADDPRFVSMNVSMVATDDNNKIILHGNGGPAPLDSLDESARFEVMRRIHNDFMNQDLDLPVLREKMMALHLDNRYFDIIVPFDRIQPLYDKEGNVRMIGAAIIDEQQNIMLFKNKHDAEYFLETPNANKDTSLYRTDFEELSLSSQRKVMEGTIEFFKAPDSRELAFKRAEDQAERMSKYDIMDKMAVDEKKDNLIQIATELVQSDGSRKNSPMDEMAVLVLHNTNTVHTNDGEKVPVQAVVFDSLTTNENEKILLFKNWNAAFDYPNGHNKIDTDFIPANEVKDRDLKSILDEAIDMAKLILAKMRTNNNQEEKADQTITQPADQKAVSPVDVPQQQQTGQTADQTTDKENMLIPLFEQPKILQNIIHEWEPVMAVAIGPDNKALLFHDMEEARDYINGGKSLPIRFDWFDNESKTEIIDTMLQTAKAKNLSLTNNMSNQISEEKTMKPDEQKQKGEQEKPDPKMQSQEKPNARDAAQTAIHDALGSDVTKLKLADNERISLSTNKGTTIDVQTVSVTKNNSLSLYGEMDGTKKSISVNQLTDESLSKLASHVEKVLSNKQNQNTEKTMETKPEVTQQAEKPQVNKEQKADAQVEQKPTQAAEQKPAQEKQASQEAQAAPKQEAAPELKPKNIDKVIEVANNAKVNAGEEQLTVVRRDNPGNTYFQAFGDDAKKIADILKQLDGVEKKEPKMIQTDANANLPGISVSQKDMLKVEQAMKDMHMPFNVVDMQGQQAKISTPGPERVEKPKVEQAAAKEQKAEQPKEREVKPIELKPDSKLQYRVDDSPFHREDSGIKNLKFYVDDKKVGEKRLSKEDREFFFADKTTEGMAAAAAKLIGKLFEKELAGQKLPDKIEFNAHPKRNQQEVTEQKPAQAAEQKPAQEQKTEQPKAREVKPVELKPDSKVEYNIAPMGNKRDFSLQLFVNDEKIGGRILKEPDRKALLSKDISSEQRNALAASLMPKYFEKELAGQKMPDTIGRHHVERKAESQEVKAAAPKEQKPAQETAQQQTKRYSNEEVFGAWKNASVEDKTTLIQRKNDKGENYYTTFNKDAEKVAAQLGKTAKDANLKDVPNSKYITINQETAEKVLRDTMKNGGQVKAVDMEGKYARIMPEPHAKQQANDISKYNVPEGKQVNEAKVKYDKNDNTWYLTAKVDGNNLGKKEISQQDASDFKKGRATAENIVGKYYSPAEMEMKQEQKQTKSLSR